MSKREKSPPNKAGLTSPTEFDKKQKLSYTEAKDKAPLGYNEHLRQEQVLDVFEKLGFSGENIISEVTLEGEVMSEGKAVPEEIPYNEISNNAALSEALKTVLGKANHNQNLILLKVNTISKSFAKRQEESNHYVALYFSQENGQTTLTYVDPTGAGISEEILRQVKAFILPHQSAGQSINIKSCADILLQFTKPEATPFGEEILGGNDYDCGVLLPLAIKLLKEGKNNIRLDEGPSRNIGQELRKLITQNEIWNNIERNIDDIIHPGHDLEQKSSRLATEDVIAATNAFIDKVYGDRIVRLDTSCLFSEENWEGIKKIFRLASDEISSVDDANKGLIKNLIMEIENFQTGQSTNQTQTGTPLEKRVLDRLSALGIEFRLISLQQKYEVIENIAKVTLYRGGSNIAVNIAENGSPIFIEITNEEDLTENSHAIHLTSQTYNYALKAIVIDSDLNKHLDGMEFHEKIHLLDHYLSLEGYNCSTEAIEKLISKNSAIKSSMRDILKNIIKVVTTEGYDFNYYLTEIDHVNGIQKGIRESMAFALQLKALGKDFDKEKRLGLNEILVLTYTIDFFEKRISEKYADNMKALIDLCDGFCKELNERLGADQHTKQPVDTHTSSKEDDRLVLGVHTKRALEDSDSNNDLHER